MSDNFIKLSNIVEFYNGYAFKSNDYIDKSNTLNCRMSNIRPNGQFDILYNAKYLPDEYAIKHSDYLLKDGDLIIAMTDMAGDPKILGIPTVVNTLGYNLLLNQRVGKLIIYNKSYTEKYLKYALSCRRIRDYFKSFAGGGVQLNVGKKEILNAEISDYSLEKQQKIVSTLDLLQSIITHRRTQLEKLDLLVKTRFVEMFGDPVSNPHNWEKKSLNELAEIKIGPFGSLLHKEDYIENAHALVNPSHISEGKIVVDLNLTVSDEKYNELSAYHLFVDDVVMGRRGEMGRCAVVTENGLLCGTGSMIIRTNGILKADFIQKIISFPSFKKTIEDMAVGQTMPNLNVPIVSNFMIICPPLEVQEQYYSFAKQTDKTKVAVQKELDKAQMLFNSLMQEYFG